MRRKRPMGLTGSLNKIQELLLRFKQNSSKITTGLFLPCAKFTFPLLSDLDLESLTTASSAPGEAEGAQESCPTGRSSGPGSYINPKTLSHSLLPLPAWGLQQILGNKEKHPSQQDVTGETTHCYSLSQATREPGSGPLSHCRTP